MVTNMKDWVIYSSDWKRDKLTSRKALSLSDVLHVPDIRLNLVSISLLGKIGVRILFDSNKIVLTKNDAFVEGLL
ncbi:hypothetical protein CK203_096222 [Vitis vinifera]|uniref:Uncharacterized protein n=1 Tax=Vitis vinifera TaxID=29760 RepID=A0A438EEX8_VITVI|nr:hypothetical protein CK203_096222 [Vitis vinifera]